MTATAELITGVLDEDLPIIRELLSYDALCPIACTFVRDQFGGVQRALLPSPLHWSRQSEWPFALKHLNPQKDHVILDIGGGWSVLKYALASRCNYLISLEVDWEFIQRTQKSIDLLGFKNIHQTQGDARKIPFYDNKFDSVCCISVLEHIDGEHLACIREAIRVLKPGGTFVLTMDVVIRGEAKGNFYVTRNNVDAILQELGVQQLWVPDKPVGAMVDQDGVDIVAMLVKYVKPLEEKDDAGGLCEDERISA